MTKGQLAKALRLRLAGKFAWERVEANVPTARDFFVRYLKNTSDENLIAGYLTCSACGQISIPVEFAVYVAESCKTPDEWLGRLTAWERLVGSCYCNIARPN